MYLIVGLGNPGAQYEATRHNAGFMVLEEVARRAGTSLDTQRFKGRFARARVAGREAALLMPQTYMNLSGESVTAAARFFKVDPEDLVVVHDEIDLPFGTIRVKLGGGLAGHNGLRSIAGLLGSQDFVRVRFGVGKPGGRSVTGHVLGGFAKGEAGELPDLVDRAADAVEAVLREGPRAAMNAFNRKATKDADEG